jgi:hypothetical protein
MFSVPGAVAQDKEIQPFEPTIVEGITLASNLAQTVRPDAPSHKFFDTRNLKKIGALTVLIATDGATTQHLIQDYKFREMNPIARPFVTRGNGGQAAASALGWAAALGTSYLFHRKGHHRLEEWTLRLLIAGESAAVVNNGVYSFEEITSRSRWRKRKYDFLPQH